MGIQPPLVVRPATSIVEMTLEEPHYSSHARRRIAVPFLQLPIEFRPGAVGLSGIAGREQYRAHLVSYSHRNPALDARGPDPLKETGQLFCWRPVFVEPRTSERVAYERLRCFATVVLVGEG